ncbi:unnamed protein product [Hermetia illucens]|uniref:Uncharacterized protein n=1 Tax=Hermetia illucens TaxID=343691 RepID=A0A7R8YT57_HERIL|nr:unnamed protein product [Hermetia illucens]
MNNVFRYSAKHVSKKMAPSVSAVLMECPKTSVAPSCQRKIMLNIRISAEGSTCKKDKYLLLDEIFDQGRKTRARLMSPYLIELSRGEPVLMYPLDFVKNLDCNSCGDKIRKSPNNLKHSQAGSNSLHVNQNAASIINKGSRRDTLRKNPQKVSVTSSKSENKRLASHEHPSSSQNNHADEIDLDINIALDDEVNNGVGSGSMKSQQFIHEEDHGNTKRNPKMIEKQESLQSDYDETNRDYDAIFEELEKKNEKIKKDILEILKPTLQLCDEADTIGTGLNYRSSSDQQQNCTDPCKCSSFTSGASESQSKANCPTCPPCPSCPTLPPLPARPECGKPDQIGQLKVPASQRHFSPRRTSKFHPSKRTNRREDNVAVKIQKELQNNELPIQETSDDSSEDAESNRRNELSNDENIDVEEAEDVFSSVDEINDDFFQPDLQSEQVEGNIKLKYHSLIPKNSESVVRNPNIPEVRLQNNNKSPFVRSKMQPSSIADFKKYQLDPIRYDGVSKVDRYQSLLGNNRAHLTSNSKGTSSSQKSNRKKDAQFVSYINGYGLNVDSVDVLNETSPDAFQSYQRLSESSMPRLQHYFMHVGTPSCPACNDPLSSIVEIPPANAFRKKSYKKSVPRMCPFGCPFPSYRKLSTSKMSPQRVHLDPGQAEVSIREWSPPMASYSKEIKTPFEVNPTEIQEEPAEMEGSYRSGSGISVKPVQSEGSQAQLQQIFPLSSKISSLHGGSNNRFALTNGLSSGDEMLADSKTEGTEVENNPELSQVPFRLNPKFRPVKLSRGFAEKPIIYCSPDFSIARENSQSQDEDGGEEYDYYEEDTSDLSDFPYVLARRPGTKFPSVYQRPVYVPSIIPAALESENPSADFITDEYREPKKRTPPQRRGTKRVIRPFHRGRFLANQEKRDEAAQILLSHIDPNLLTDRVPYDSFLSDPNISVGEKLRLMNVIDPEDAQFEALLKYLETEVQNSHPPYYITKIDREEIPISDETNSGNEDGGHEKNIEKRSFALYDDMEIHDVDVDYEGLTAARHLPVFDSFKQSGSPVAGKHSKRGNKGDSGKSPRSVEDIWYSVFNMSAPLQFLTTRVRVFRKKENSWWRIAPSITLTSLSGIYANANLSIMFSSHVELYNLEKPLHLQDYKLLIPNNHTSNITPKEILAVNTNKFHMDKIETDEDLRDNICEAAFSKSKLYSDNKSFVHKRNGQDDSIHSLEDFGEFPTFMNILEQCKNDPSHLCLNMLDEKTPGYKVKVQIPFRDNSLVYKDYFKVRITSVVVDGTVDGAIQIIVSFINEALLVQDFDVVIADCPVTCGAKNIVHKVAPPHRGVTIAFLLPLQDTNSGSKYTCQGE